MRGEFELHTPYWISKWKNLKNARHDYDFATNRLEYKCKLFQFIELSDGIKIGIDISNRT